MTLSSATPFSLYAASLPVFQHGLNNLRAILGKAHAHAKLKHIDEAVLIGSRLYPDMLPLAAQIHIAADTAKYSAARLAGQEAPKFADDETTFDAFFERLDKTQAYLNTFNASQINGAEARPVTVKIRDNTLEFTGTTYLLTFALPNFFFHLTTAYDILRHCGVELGKRDFLGRHNP